MGAEEKLQAWEKKTIGKRELERLLCTQSDEALYAALSELVSKGILSPVKASGTSGNKSWPIWLKYRITFEKDDSEARREISLLHPLLTKNGILQEKPDQYLKYRQQLNKLNRYLFNTGTPVSVSKKERSFEIFDDEKQLEDRSFLNFLSRLGISAETLRYYETPEYCFNDFIPVRKPQMTLLICENKDIWFNIRRRMYEDGVHELFGTPIDGVVYGCGNKVSMVNALTEYIGFMGAEKIRCLYWGDLDRAGLDIYLSLVKNNPSEDISLFLPAYEKMLQLSENRPIPDSDDHREKSSSYESIYVLFSESSRERMRHLLNENKRVPQEIVSYECLLTDMR